MYEYTGSGFITVKHTQTKVEVLFNFVLPVYSTYYSFISDGQVYPERFWDWITRIKISRAILKPSFLSHPPISPILIRGQYA